jgi:predicted phosphate transport protein (TIGR00153 family)
MFKRIFCRETEFERFMLAYADNIEKCGDEFCRFIKCFDPEKLDEWVKNMNDIEHACDDVTHQTMNWLESTFIVNYDREDIHTLSSDLDDIVDFMDAAAMRVSLYNVDKIIPDVVLLSEKLNAACHETAKAIRAISGEKLSRDVLEICKNIKNYEEEGDMIYHGVLAALFRDGKDPLYVIKFKEIIEEIERSLDKCNQSAMNVESVVLKYS